MRRRERVAGAVAKEKTWVEGYEDDQGEKKVLAVGHGGAWGGLRAGGLLLVAGRWSLGASCWLLLRFLRADGHRAPYWF